MQSEAKRALTLGASDSIACSFPFVRCNTCKHRGQYTWEEHTSQFSRMKQRPPVTDLSGPKASADSLTPRRSSLAVADTVDFHPDFFSPAVLGLLLLGWVASWMGLGTAEVPAFTEETIKDGTTGRIVHILSGFPLSMCEIDGIDVGGLTSTTSLPSPAFSARLGPLFATSSVSGCRWEFWPASLSSASVPPPPRLLSLLDPSLRLRMPSTNRFFNFLNGFDTESRMSMSMLCRCRVEMMVRWQIAGPRGHKRPPPCHASSFHKLQ